MPPRKKKSGQKPAPKQRQNAPSRRKDVPISAETVKDSDIDQGSEDGSDDDDGFIVSDDSNQGHSNSEFTT